MAANSSSFIRVRLFFDYPPPSVVDCRMCWLLVDLNSCRVVSDLESLIRDKFEFSSRTIFNLFIDDCYLPHTESIFLVRDNDSVWVKVETAAQLNGHSICSDTSSKTSRKRNRPTDEDWAGADEGSVEQKRKKKKKKKSKECLNEETDQVCGSKKRSKDKRAKKEKKKMQKTEKNISAVTPRPAATTMKKPTGAKEKTQSKKTTESSSESSEDHEASSKTATSKPKPKTQLSTIKTTTTSGNNNKQKTTLSQKSVVPSGSSSSSEEDETPRMQTNSKRQPCTPAAVKAPAADKPIQKKTQKSSDSSSSEDSEDSEVSKKPLASKLVSKPSLSKPAASKASTGARLAQSKSKPTSSSSSETSSDETTSVRAPSIGKHLVSLSPQHNSNSVKTQSSSLLEQQTCIEATPPLGDGPSARPNSDSEEDIKLIIRKPNQPMLKGNGGQSSWRGGNNRRPGGGGRGSRGDRGRGCGRGDVRGRTGHFGSNCNGAVEPSYQTDLLTNESVVIQNGAEVDAAPKKDYSAMPLLAAAPQVGQRIAFKLLELTENYTPEVSEYKEGKIVSFDPRTKQMELELFNETNAPVEPGKFDLVYQNPDGSERVEYAVSRGTWLTERWESLLEPRLLI